ncbi:DUF4190 domain-containing protein [Conyzicola sp.]|uniref:DUF4190 domain-containing protein n=1 Tax=Conyzicola sp. TaxID=1969404 RepID=UPI003989F427
MTNADDQTPPPVPPAPPASANPPAASPAAPAYSAAPPAYSAAPPTYTPGAPQNPYTPGVVGPPRGLSVTSMVLGIVGILFGGFGLLISIAAVITGHMAQRRQPYAKPFWLTGIITGYVGILIGLVVSAFIIFAIILAMSDPSSGSYYNS